VSDFDLIGIIFHPWVIALCLGIAAAILGRVAYQHYRELRRLREQFAPVIDARAEVEAAQRAFAGALRERQAIEVEGDKRRVQLMQDYARAKSTYDALKKELFTLEENLEDISYGLYKPHFSFETSAQYRLQIETMKEQQRRLIREGKAAVCFAKWTVGGSEKDGARMTKQYLKLLLRAFNGECDAAIAKVAWNNATKMEERIRKSFEAINEMGTIIQTAITQDYLDLKLRELWLTYEHEEKRHEEQEEQRRIREQIREEERVQRELDKAREDAEREEARFQKALEKARAEAARASAAQLEEMNQRVAALQAQLEEARRQKERAISQAQITKSGYVYVISNVGSFGENVYKIGMTRRLEPMERVQELGDASVPFPFDVHAMLYTENAPGLEKSLHEFFSKRRVNLVNPRKEFFRVSLDEIEQFAERKGLKIEFTKIAEAKEYRESLSLIRQRVSSPAPPPPDHSDGFPSGLFSEANSGKSFGAGIPS
jgi:hypothetical protein